MWLATFALLQRVLVLAACLNSHIPISHPSTTILLLLGFTSKMLAICTVLPLFAVLSVVAAQVTPITPGPNETFYAGSNCTIAWDTDPSGLWKSMTIGTSLTHVYHDLPLTPVQDLMSGSNTNMSHVTNVAMDLDGTNAYLTPFNWTCPAVDPYSTIYFYQVSSLFWRLQRFSQFVFSVHK